MSAVALSFDESLIGQGVSERSKEEEVGRADTFDRWGQVKPI